MLSQTRLVVRLAPVLWRADRRGSLLFVFLVLARSAGPLAFALAVAQVLTAVPDAVESGLDSPAGSRLFLGVLWMAVAFVVQQTARLSSRRSVTRWGGGSPTTWISG